MEWSHGQRGPKLKSAKQTMSVSVYNHKVEMLMYLLILWYNNENMSKNKINAVPFVDTWGTLPWFPYTQTIFKSNEMKPYVKK